MVNHRVCRGSISSGVRKEPFLQGDIVAEGTFPKEELASLLAAGVLEEYTGTAAPIAAPVKGETKSPWVFSPDDLKGRSLPELNAIIADKDPALPAATTIKEAIALLTKDFGKQS